MSDSNSLLILFVHLERSGGSTVNGWFASTEKHFTEGVNYFEYNDPKSIALSVDSLADPKICYLSGHFSLEAALSINGVSKFSRILLMTTLRKPQDRILSGFRLWLRSPDWFPDLYGCPKTLPHYYEAIRSFYSINLACRRISGCQDASVAAEILRKRFALVGISEDFSSFKTRLTDRLQELIPNFKLVGENTISNQGLGLSADEFEQYGLTKELIMQIQSDNSEDQRLYESLSHSWYSDDYWRMRLQFA